MLQHLIWNAQKNNILFTWTVSNPEHHHMCVHANPLTLVLMPQFGCLCFTVSAVQTPACRDLRSITDWEIN